MSQIEKPRNVRNPHVASAVRVPFDNFSADVNAEVPHAFYEAPPFTTVLCQVCQKPTDQNGRDRGLRIVTHERG